MMKTFKQYLATEAINPLKLIGRSVPASIEYLLDNGGVLPEEEEFARFKTDPKLMTVYAGFILKGQSKELESKIHDLNDPKLWRIYQSLKQLSTSGNKLSEIIPSIESLIKLDSEFFTQYGQYILNRLTPDWSNMSTSDAEMAYRLAERMLLEDPDQAILGTSFYDNLLKSAEQYVIDDMMRKGFKEEAESCEALSAYFGSPWILMAVISTTGGDGSPSTDAEKAKEQVAYILFDGVADGGRDVFKPGGDLEVLSGYFRKHPDILDEYIQHSKGKFPSLILLQKSIKEGK